MATYLFIGGAVLLCLLFLSSASRTEEAAPEWEVWEDGAQSPPAPRRYSHFVALQCQNNSADGWIADRLRYDDETIVGNPQNGLFIIGTNDLSDFLNRCSAWVEEYYQVIGPDDPREILTLPRGWMGVLNQGQINAARLGGCNVRVIARSNQRDPWNVGIWDCEVV